MTNIVPFIQQMEAIKAIEEQVKQIGEENPEKAYLIGIAFGKMADGFKKEFQKGFRNYYDVNKELPGGFECKVSNRKSYAFEENAEWAEKKAELDAIEERLKKASDSYFQDGSYQVDSTTGEIFPTVSVKNTEVYSVTRK